MKQTFSTFPQKYFLKLLHINGENLFGFQTSHLMVLYFIVQGLASNNKINLLNQHKQKIIKYVKSLQLQNGGFAPSSLYTNYQKNHKYNISHIVFTYSAINILQNLNSLTVLNKQKCLQSIKKCQKQNGSFSNFQNSNQADLRFVYAAVAISNSFKDFTYLNIKKIQSYLNSCYNYDGGYGLRPFCQSHSGAIYCSLATYKMLGLQIKNKQKTLQFLVSRQTQNQSSQIVGVQGRVGKLPDSCYTFWVGASIKILTGQNLLNEYIQNFIQLCYHQDSYNFSKYPHNKGDPLHTLHSTVGLKILKGQDSNINILQGCINQIN